jgi:predicted RNA binding protein YcfA (HicA-like mRNA interferase family)
MPGLPVLKAGEILRALLKAGFTIHHQRGSHARLVHPGKPGARVTLPVHNREVPLKTLRSIIRQAGLTEEEFLNLLK